MRKVKVSDLPSSTNIDGMVMLGVDSNNNSVKIPLDTVLEPYAKTSEVPTSADEISVDESGIQSTNVADALSELNDNITNEATARATADENNMSIVQAQFDALIEQIKQTNDHVEGYMRVAGSSDPSLSYRTFASDFGTSVFEMFTPCLVGTRLTGDCGKVLHVLQKLNINKDIEGNNRAIDGSEGELMICTLQSFYRLAGHYTVNGVVYDIYLMSRLPFSLFGYDAEEVKPMGLSPDYCMGWKESGDLDCIRSAYNPNKTGLYVDPYAVQGKFVYSEVEGEIVETYDDSEPMLGSANGKNIGSLALPVAEQRAMNLNTDTTSTLPFFNYTVQAFEWWWSAMIAEGGTFDMHNKTKMGAGWSANDAVAKDSDVTDLESNDNVINMWRFKDKDDNWKYGNWGYNLTTNWGVGTNWNARGTMGGDRNPFNTLEAYRVLCHAIQNNISELTWFVFEGNKYKWRSIPGMKSPLQGEATAVVFKFMATKIANGATDPTDHTTSIAGNRVEYLIPCALYHGITTSVSPLWWTSGMLFSQYDDGSYKCYVEKDQSKLKKADYDGVSNYTFDEDTSTFYETAWKKAGGDIAKQTNYIKDYADETPLMTKDTNQFASNMLHTYIGAYRLYNGGNPASGKKIVRGSLRGGNANSSVLSPLFVNANYSPSFTATYFGLGICCQLVTE